MIDFVPKLAGDRPIEQLAAEFAVGIVSGRGLLSVRVPPNPRPVTPAVVKAAFDTDLSVGMPPDELADWFFVVKHSFVFFLTRGVPRRESTVTFDFTHGSVRSHFYC